MSTEFEKVKKIALETLSCAAGIPMRFYPNEVMPTTKILEISEPLIGKLIDFILDKSETTEIKELLKLNCWKVWCLFPILGENIVEAQKELDVVLENATKEINWIMISSNNSDLRNYKLSKTQNNNP